MTATTNMAATGDLSAADPATPTATTTATAPTTATATADDSPLVTAPTPREGWFVSLVPPPDSLPLEVDLRGPSDPAPPAPVAETAAPPASPDPAVRLTDPAVRPAAPLPPELSPRPGGPAAPGAERPAPAVRPVATTPPGVRSLWQGGLPTPAVLGVAALVLLPGIVLDLARDGTFGLPSTVFFVLAAAGVPLLLRTRSLAVGAVLPPLLFAGAAIAIAWRSGLNQGTRQIGLDVGTTMAVNAPLLFAGTALAVAVVAGRLVVRLVRR